ncbi:MAG: CDP-diacylglycerol---glycerol-3-phosphate 3-phosphatidyltransferase [Actinomycetota bacterium]|nr:CDP-diacylglycerol---glycerol-3-phosphate 3-phosphatidyltransferase [Actinomycetota bacterium]
MLDSKIRPYWDKLMRPVGRALGRTPLSPNAVTLFGVVIQGVVGWLIIEGRLVAAGFIAIISALLDVFDGALAKAKDRVTKFGAFLDSTTDRLSDALLFVPIAWLYGVSPDVKAHDEPWVAAVALVALVASLLVSYVKARAEGLGFDAKVGIAERAERVILVIIALVFNDLLPPIMVVLAVISVITVLQRIAHVYKQDRAL